MTYFVKLQKVESTHKNLRTDVIEGLTHELPAIGSQFTILGDPLNKMPDCIRIIRTTEVAKLDASNTNTETEGKLIFQTLNSVYSLTYIKDRRNNR